MRHPIGIRPKWELQQLSQIIFIPIKTMLTHNVTSVLITFSRTNCLLSLVSFESGYSSVSRVAFRPGHPASLSKTRFLRKHSHRLLCQAERNQTRAGLQTLHPVAACGLQVGRKALLPHFTIRCHHGGLPAGGAVRAPPRSVLNTTWGRPWRSPLGGRGCSWPQAPAPFHGCHTPPSAAEETPLGWAQRR